MKKNLLPLKFNKGPVHEIIKGLVAANILVALFFSAWFALYHQTNKGMEEQIAGVKSQIEITKKEVSDKQIELKTDDLYKVLVDKKAKKETGDMQIEEDLSYNLFVQKVNSVTPDTIRLTSLDYSAAGNIVLSGQSTDFQYVSEFYKGLVQQKIIESGQLQEVQVIPTVEGGNHANKEVVYFEIKGGDIIEEAE